MNGSTVEQIRKFGLIDPQIASDGGIKLVMSKPLLRLILAEGQLLEKVLTGGANTLPSNALSPSKLEAEAQSQIAPAAYSSLAATTAMR